MTTTFGLHHITAIASDPKQNYDFYTKILGLRFIKKTVNFDDPTTYHFYYGDAVGSPGTALTFFPHPGLPRGQAGLGQAVEIGFSIPQNAFSFWIDRFHQLGIPFQGPETRFGEKLIRITDPDGLMLELITVADPLPDTGWAIDDIPADMAIRGFHSVTLWLDKPEKTTALMTNYFGFKSIGVEDSRERFSTGLPGVGQIIDVRTLPGVWRGKPGAGTIHHVAVRAGNDEQELVLREALSDGGFHVTPVVDRYYFHSVYFRERNGILFELATDNPGFDVDEPVESLGQTLQIPPQYREHGEAIAKALPSLD